MNPVDELSLSGPQMLDNLVKLTVPHIDQYFGVWAIKEDVFRSAVDRVNGLDLHAHVEARQGEPAARDGDGFSMTRGGVAVIEMTGPLMKHVSSLSGGTSTIEVRRAIRNAVQDDDVSAIAIRIDSPGGTVSGTADLAADVAAAASAKPVHAFIEDLGASAAFWIASQATKVFATESSLVGSIGTFSVIQDLSGMAAQQGVKVHVIRAGSFKGVGTAGTEVTPEQLAEFQRIVDGLNEFFVKGVASGRNMAVDAVRELADGRVHVAGEAKKLGLIDGVQSFDRTLNGLSRIAKANSRTNAAQDQENVMSTETTTVVAPSAATIQELKKAIPDADAGFLLECLEMGATVADAKDLWMDHLRSQVKEKDAEAAKAREEAKAAAESAKAPGNDPLGDGSTGASAESGDALTQYRDAVDAKMARGMKRHEAYRAVARENPELLAAYTQAYNEQHKRRRAG